MDTNYKFGRITAVVSMLSVILITQSSQLLNIPVPVSGLSYLHITSLSQLEPSNVIQSHPCFHYATAFKCTSAVGIGR
jgi:hypothetical protein